MSKTLATLGASVLLCASQLAHAYLPGSVSGPFYNPQQSGHGISITIATDQSAIAIWHVYNTDGDPLTLYIEGNVEGRRIVGQAYAPEGMRFGDFNSADVQVSHWGSVDIAFDDCDHATLSWVADDLAYGDGEMTIRRLTQPIGVECTLSTRDNDPIAHYLEPGLFQGSGSGEATYAMQGVRDEDLAFWGIERQFDMDGRPVGNIPSPLSNRSSGISAPNTVYVTRDWHSSSRRKMIDFKTPLTWLQGEPSMQVSYSSEYWSEILGFPYIQAPGTGWLFEFRATSELVTSLSGADLVGTYRVPFRDGQGEMTISEDGSICLAVPGIDAACAGNGAVSVSYPDLGMVDFRLVMTKGSSTATYFGRGWLADADYGRELVLVGHPDGGKGFGLVAIKEE